MAYQRRPDKAAPRRPARRGPRRLQAASCLALGLLCACAGPPATYDLAAVPTPDAGRSSGHAQLAVDLPGATLPMDSDRIVIRTGPEAVAYLKGAQWADTLPRLVQARLIDAFEASHRVRGVGRPGIVADYTVHADIRRFEADVTAHQARVELGVRLIRANGRIVAAQDFEGTAPFATDSGAEITAALDKALRQALLGTVRWTTQRI